MLWGGVPPAGMAEDPDATWIPRSTPQPGRSPSDDRGYRSPTPVRPDQAQRMAACDRCREILQALSLQCCEVCSAVGCPGCQARHKCEPAGPYEAARAIAFTAAAQTKKPEDTSRRNSGAGPMQGSRKDRVANRNSEAPPEAVSHRRTTAVFPRQTRGSSSHTEGRKSISTVVWARPPPTQVCGN